MRAELCALTVFALVLASPTRGLAQDDDVTPLPAAATPLDAAAWLDLVWASFGPPEALEALGGVRMKGRASALTSDFSGPFEELYHTDGRALQRIEFQGSDPVLFGVDGRLSWEAWSDQGVAKFDWHAAADFRRFFLHRHAATPGRLAPGPTAPWRALYRDAAVGGRAQVDGKACVRLVLTPRAAKEHGLAEVAPRRQPEPDILWVDEATHVPVRLEMEMLRPAEGEIRLKETYSDWREVAGVRFPFVRKMEVPGAGLVFTLEAVEVGVTVAESAFDVPPTMTDTVADSFPTAVRLPFAEWRVIEREARTAVVLRTECAAGDEALHVGASRRALAAFAAEAGVAATEAASVRVLERGEVVRFEVVLPVDKAPAIPPARAEELVVEGLPAGTYVEGRHVGARDRLAETWLRLDHFVRVNHLVAVGASEEVLELDPDAPGDPAAWRCVVRARVKPR